MNGHTAVDSLRGVLVNSEGLLFRHGRILPESFVHPYYAAHYRRLRGYVAFLVKNYVMRPSIAPVACGLWITDNFSFGSYHHWLIDSLPRLIEAERVAPNDAMLLLPAAFRRDPYVPYTLRAFPHIRKIHWIESRCVVRVADLTVIPRPSEYRPGLLQETARRVQQVAGKPGSARRIYLSRADATRRRAHNERDVRRALAAEGFEIVVIDPADPGEQVRACAGADLIVGIHGASLSNLIFMQPGGRVVELRRPEAPDVFFFDHYRWLAKATGMAYRSIECDMVAPSIGLDMNNADLVVDLDSLLESLDPSEWDPPSPPQSVPVEFGARPDFA